eukprot:gb/GECG01002420.1/.p1 GENE.gb/GECG01002420.1/~~gb/GECG01002420.1/.p1  ORF type:complete len:1600 (+),score=170.13 gb/GECG01002420.1/:1-4800(+)
MSSKRADPKWSVSTTRFSRISSYDGQNGANSRQGGGQIVLREQYWRPRKDPYSFQSVLWTYLDTVASGFETFGKDLPKDKCGTPTLWLIVPDDETFVFYNEILTELFAIHRRETQGNTEIGAIMLENICEGVRNYKLLKRGRTLNNFLSEYCLDVEQQRQSRIASSREFSKPYGVFLPTHGNLVGISNFSCSRMDHGRSSTPVRRYLTRHHGFQSTDEEASYTKFAFSMAALAREVREWNKSHASQVPLQVCLGMVTSRDYSRFPRPAKILSEAGVNIDRAPARFATAKTVQVQCLSPRALIEWLLSDTTESSTNLKDPIHCSPAVKDQLLELYEQVAYQHEQILTGTSAETELNTMAQDNAPHVIREEYVSFRGDRDTGYKKYLPLEVCQRLQNEGLAVSGKLNVSRYDPDVAYVDASSNITDSCGQKFQRIMINGFTARNRSIHGDLVFVLIWPERCWSASQESKRSRTAAKVEFVPYGETIGVVERTGWRELVATSEDRSNVDGATPNERTSMLVPMSQRVPKIIIRTKDPDALAGKRHLVIIDDWPVNSKYPKGHIIRTLGCVLELEVELKALMYEQNVHHHCLPFPPSALSCLPAPSLQEDGTRSSWSVAQERRRELHILEKEGASPSRDSEGAMLYRSRVGYFDGNQLWETPRFEKNVPRDGVRDIFRDTEGARVDLRRTHVICSVDPPGCVDIDDALSFRELSNGNLEVGVHIADVSHFVRRSTSLDQEACSRGTTLYFPDRRFNMLPELLSEDICSLHPDVDRFSVSVFWQLSPCNQQTEQYIKSLSQRDGSIDPAIEETQFKLAVDDNGVPLIWMGPSIIRSAAALSYDQADKLIHSGDLAPNKTGFGYDGPLQSLRFTLRGLFTVCRFLRRWRQQSGSVNFGHSSETAFHVDELQGRPEMVEDDSEHSEVHETIADLMIFANSTVASFLCWKFPNHALIRRHLPALGDRFEELFQILESSGIDVKSIDISSNKKLAKFLDGLERNEVNGQRISEESVSYIRNMTVRAMTEAEYICSESLDVSFPSVDKKTWMQDFVTSTEACNEDSNVGHYGLGLRRYTHFTSPIRRYADLVVHRLLKDALALPSKYQLSADSDASGAVKPPSTFQMKFSDLFQRGNSSCTAAFNDLDVDQLLGGTESIEAGSGANYSPRAPAEKEEGTADYNEEHDRQLQFDTAPDTSRPMDSSGGIEHREYRSIDEASEDSLLDDLLDLDLDKDYSSYGRGRKGKVSGDVALKSSTAGEVDERANPSKVASTSHRKTVSDEKVQDAPKPVSPDYTAKALASICNQANIRHREAKIASRECEELYLALHFATRVEIVKGVIGSTYSNRIRVYVPKYEIEGTVFLTDSAGTLTIPPQFLKGTSKADNAFSFEQMSETLNFNVGNLEKRSWEAVKDLSDNGCLRVPIYEGTLNHCLSESKLSIEVDQRVIASFQPLDKVQLLVTCDFHSARVRRPPLRYELLGSPSCNKLHDIPSSSAPKNEVSNDTQVHHLSAGETDEPSWKNPIVRMNERPQLVEDTFISLKPPHLKGKLRLNRKPSLVIYPGQASTEDDEPRSQVSTGSGKPLRVLVHSRGRFYFKGHARREVGLVS